MSRWWVGDGSAENTKRQRTIQRRNIKEECVYKKSHKFQVIVNFPVDKNGKSMIKVCYSQINFS